MNNSKKLSKIKKIVYSIYFNLANNKIEAYLENKNFNNKKFLLPRKQFSKMI